LEKIMSKGKLLAFAATVAVGALAAPTASWANFIETFTTQAGSTAGGSGVSSTATFVDVGSTLTVTLTENSPTASKGQILDGLFFDIVGTNPALGSAPRPTATASNLFAAKTTFTSNANITGGWLLREPVSGFEYGLSAVGGGGLFPTNQFTKGGGGDDYGIVGAGTNLAASDFKNDFPYVEDTVTFTLTGFTGTDIEDVEFGYNSSLSSEVRGTLQPVPEPAPLLVLAASLAVFGLMRRKVA
jgi:hypothetical protein